MCFSLSSFKSSVCHIVVPVKNINSIFIYNESKYLHITHTHIKSSLSQKQKKRYLKGYIPGVEPRSGSVSPVRDLLETSSVLNPRVKKFKRLPLTTLVGPGSPPQKWLTPRETAYTISPSCSTIAELCPFSTAVKDQFNQRQDRQLRVMCFYTHWAERGRYQLTIDLRLGDPRVTAHCTSGLSSHPQSTGRWGIYFLDLTSRSLQRTDRKLHQEEQNIDVSER